MSAGDGALECSLTLTKTCKGGEEASWPVKQEGKMLGHARTIWGTETIKMKIRQRCNQMPDELTCSAPSRLVFQGVVMLLLIRLRIHSWKAYYGIAIADI